MISITDEDIDRAEKIFLPEGEQFDEERRKAIKCLESKNIQACPGSGKTTALLAKLFILSKKMSFKDNRGICVLTHTNVAIDEIRESLGYVGNILFNYPNFFGTIQSFVDKFLAIPAYSHYYGGSIVRIDNEIYYEMIERESKFLPRNVKGNLSIKARTKRTSIVEELGVIRFDPNEFNNLVEGINGDAIYKDKNGVMFKEILGFKEKILEKGILCFDDAYSLAFRYMRDFNPLLRDAFSSRFSYVFIDEMQDTDLHQLRIIEQIFDPSSVIIQMIGDPNQAIYASEASRIIGTAWDSGRTCLNINGSKRFSNSIADKVKLLCVNKQEIKGNSRIDNIAPKIIIFNDSTMGKILNKFIDLIIDNKVHLLSRKRYKVIGWVGKEKEARRTIPSYYNNYNRTMQLKKLDFSKLEDYLKDNKSPFINDNEAFYYRSSILRAILKLLRLANIRDDRSRYFSERSFIKFIKNDYNDFYELTTMNMAKWCLDMGNKKDIFDEVKQFFLCDLRSVIKFDITGDIAKFFDRENSKKQHEQVSINKDNIYNYRGVTLELATVHSVKGETHTATLYLETFYREYDIQRIIKYLIGIYTKPNKYEYEALKVAFVGMSRPTHLLCIAAHEDTILPHKQKLEQIGWEIIPV